MVLFSLIILFASSSLHKSASARRFISSPQDFQTVLSWDDDPHEALFFLQDGRVGRLNPSSPIFAGIKSRLKSGFQLELRIDTKDRVIDAKALAQKLTTPPSAGADQTPSTSPGEEPPSILTSKEAEDVFHSMNPRYRRRSQCFNRAHVWTYETLKFREIRLMKVFMFFTAKYIREYHYRWWFHVSPFAYVTNQGRVEESILDYTFMNGPIDAKGWSDHFIAAKTPCPTVEKYSDYSNHQYEHYCYFMKVPMYFWQPRHLEAYETGAPEPTQFQEEDVQSAYAQGFYGSRSIQSLQSQL